MPRPRVGSSGRFEPHGWPVDAAAAIAAVFRDLPFRTRLGSGTTGCADGNACTGYTNGRLDGNTV